MEFNTQLIEQYTPMIHKLINEKMDGYNSSDFCYEYEDIFQDCVLWLKYAAETYEEGRGYKESSYVYKVLDSRLGNMMNKVRRHNYNGTINYSDACAIYSCEDQSLPPQDYVFAVAEKHDTLNCDWEEMLITYIDAKKLSENLKGIKKVLFEEIYIKHKKINEIVEMFPDMKYHQIKKHLNQVRNIVDILVKGNISGAIN